MKEKIAFLLALIFLIHPMNVVSVTFISAAAGPMFVMFGLSAFLINTNEKLHWSIKYPLIFVLLLLGAISREEGLYFGILILCFDLIFKRKLFTYSLIPIVFAGAVYFYLRLSFAGVIFVTDQLVPIMRLSFIERVFNIPAIITYYLRTFFLPIQLVTNQQWTITSLSFWGFYLPITILIFFSIAFVLIAIKLKQKYPKELPKFIFFMIWFVTSLCLYLQIIPLDYTVSNRWFYVPIIGLLGMLGILINNVNIRFNSKNVTLLTLIVLVLLATRSYIRTTNWKDEVTLFAHDSEITTNFSTEGNLGLAFYQKGQYKQALAHLKQSVDMFAYDANLLLLAQTYQHLNDLKNAEKYYILAAETHSYGDDYHAKIIYKVIASFLIEHNNTAARKVILSGLKAYPTSYRLQSLYVVNEMRLGNNQEALISAISNMQKTPNHLTINLVGDIINHKDIKINEEYLN